MICLKDDKQGAELLTDYCAGALDAMRAAELEAHFHECAACRKEVEAQRGVWNALDAWTPLEVSPGFDTKLYARIAAKQSQPWWMVVRQRVLWKPLFPVAAAAAALTVILLIWNPALKAPSQPMPSSAAVAVEKIDVQQVEQALDDMDLLSPVGQASRPL